MPRALVLGNGNMLICHDRWGQVRDLYFPYVGHENHTPNCSHKIGVWVDGAFSWLSDGTWNISINYEEESLVGDITAENERLGITLHLTDIVYNEENIYIREARVRNNTQEIKDVRVFFHQQFWISGVSHGNTAYYEPDIDAIIHYRGGRVFLIGGARGDESFDDYSIGIFNIEGKDGTWRDAEDGVLSKNPVEHGSVDSVLSFNEKLGGGKTYEFTYWLAAATRIEVAKELERHIRLKKTSHMLDTTRDYWWAWVNKLNINFEDLAPHLVSLFKKSLLIMRTHADNRGAIIASGDSDILQHGRDTYSYMWPRDAAITAHAFDEAGYFEVSSRFFKLCSDLLGEDGYLLHKYLPDGSLGSSWHPWVHKGRRQLAIQEDETALVLYALWHHYARHRDLEFVEKIYNSFIKRTADFMYFYRDEKTKLPYGSYDLWEEKWGTSTYTASSVYGALVAASRFARVLGKDEDARKYAGAAHTTKEAILKYLYNTDTNCFSKLVDLRGREPVYDKTLDVSSFYGPYRFGVLHVSDLRLTKAFEALDQHLCCRIDRAEIGGVLRYEGDAYFKRERDVAGNPWIITTLWMYQYKIDSAHSLGDLADVREGLNWVAQRAQPSGILSEQLDPDTGEQISVAPLTWSHAEFILTIFRYVRKLRALDGSKK